MTKVAPHFSATPPRMVRDRKSVLPPAAVPMTTRTGLVGKPGGFCACAEVNAAIARNLQKTNVHFVVVTADAAPLVSAIVGHVPSPISYAGKVDQSVLDEDKQSVSFDLGLEQGDIRVVQPQALFER